MTNSQKVAGQRASRSAIRRFVLAVALAISSGFVSGFAGAPFIIPDKAAGCSFTAGCVSCVLDTCGALPLGWTEIVVTQKKPIRCVEYDQQPPHHCATVTVLDLEVYNEEHVLEFTCIQSDCCDGTPNSTECTFPYTCTWEVD